jgi:hypothetical protein
MSLCLESVAFSDRRSMRPGNSRFANTIPHRSPICTATSLTPELRRQSPAAAWTDAVYDRRSEALVRFTGALYRQKRVLIKHFFDLPALHMPFAEPAHYVSTPRAIHPRLGRNLSNHQLFQEQHEAFQSDGTRFEEKEESETR